MHTCGTAKGVACLQQLKSGYAGITTGSCDVLLALARAVLGIALCGWRSTSSVTPTGCAAVTEGEGEGEGEREGRSEREEEEGREKRGERRGWEEGLNRMCTNISRYHPGITYFGNWKNPGRQRSHALPPTPSLAHVHSPVVTSHTLLSDP